jgi:hypothetical protein
MSYMQNERSAMSNHKTHKKKRKIIIPMIKKLL